MTSASPYLITYAKALLAGAAIATLAVNIDAGTYYDIIEWHPFDSNPLAKLRLFYPGFTLATVVSSLLMPLFVLLIAKELWEALVLEQGTLRGKLAVAPLVMVAGGMIVSALVWQGLTAWLETAEEAVDATGWVMPFGSDMVLAYFFGRMIFGKGHAALQVLLFLCIMDGLLGLVLGGVAAPINYNFRQLWLILPLGAAAFGYFVLTKPLQSPTVTERDRLRAGRLWPWLVLGFFSWIGMSASGLPPLLAFLPLLPVMLHGDRSFGLFAEAEGFLNDPLNRVVHFLTVPVAVILFLFGLTRGAMDLGAFGPTTWIMLGALWLGKPLGIFATAALLKALGRPLPNRLGLPEMAYIAGLMAIGFTFPLIALETALPGGAMQEAARLGLGLSLLIGPALVLVSRYALPLPRKGGKATKH
ncbi:Na+/H+ antiporter NhaA [Pseudorhodobacter ferrugineus]|uniref:Na+/H+ antiporter NhaA n=1 Tax=Pseudorhodobacter ferrugineus TaxID=77008 RepID=UPI000423AE81|nr:Na+/H+ antiporter NhaA [Pseudorhodobacter ferrugineus]